MMNRAEYWILHRAVTYHAWLPDVAYECHLSHHETAIAADRLFQRGDILALVIPEQDLEKLGRASSVEEYLSHYTRTLTLDEIYANLDRKLTASYILTSQGGARWEAVAQANWNQYFFWSFTHRSLENEILEWKLICPSEELLKQLLSIRGYVESDIAVPDTEIWDTITPWRAMYWKTLPVAYRVCYQAKVADNDISNPALSQCESYWQAGRWHAEIRKWYHHPDLEDPSLDLANDTEISLTITLPQTRQEKIAYYMLKRVVERYGDHYQDFAGVALDYQFSHAETLAVAHYLFQRNLILASIIRGGTQTMDVVMTISEIQASLDGGLLAIYYLTTEGGAQWEDLAHPNWNRYFHYSCQDKNPKQREYECEVIGTGRAEIEKFLSLSRYISIDEIYIAGTEVWDVVQPWQATYWKTLPSALRVRYLARRKEKYIDDSQLSLEEAEARQKAISEWQVESQWYTDPAW